MIFCCAEFSYKFINFFEPFHIVTDPAYEFHTKNTILNQTKA